MKKAFWSLGGRTPSHYAGNWLRLLMVRTGHTPHAIRHAVISALYDVEVPDYLVKQLVGHALHEGQSARYDKGRGLDKLQVAIARLQWV
jgi:hypothetical protein